MSKQEFPELAPPPWLRREAETTVHETGVWGLFVDGRKLDSGFPNTSRWLSVLMKQVCKAFPWASIHDAEIGLSSGAIDWQREEVGFGEWLRRNVDHDAVCGGMVGSIDLELLWIGSEGRRGCSMFPQAGRILVDPNPHNTSTWSEVYCSILVKCNLFTATIVSDDGSTLIDIEEAAQRNRQRLAKSLHDWESISGGEIREWESSLVSGIERYGFDANCAEL